MNKWNEVAIGLILYDHVLALLCLPVSEPSPSVQFYNCSDYLIPFP
jgi:hypothetical protein